MTPVLVSFVNKSAKLAPDLAATHVAAIGRQLAEDYGPIWLNRLAVEYVLPGGRPHHGSCVATYSDHPDVPGAGGYHDEGEDGKPYIKIFVLDDRTDVTASHETLEFAEDGPANIWVDGPNGYSYARELCDWVEGDTYESPYYPGVMLSNFLFPAAFDPKSQPGEKLDFLGKLAKPFTMTPTGYMIVRNEKRAKVSEVYAHAQELHPGSTVHHVKGDVHVIFGSDYPQEKKAHKLAKCYRLRCR